MSALNARISKLEQQLLAKHDGSCLACALARMDSGEVECSGQCCALGLADLLMEVSLCASR